MFVNVVILPKNPKCFRQSSGRGSDASCRRRGSSLRLACCSVRTCARPPERPAQNHRNGTCKDHQQGVCHRRGHDEGKLYWCPSPVLQGPICMAANSCANSTAKFNTSPEKSRKNIYFTDVRRSILSCKGCGMCRYSLKTREKKGINPD